MAIIPDFLLKRVYQKGSLRQTAEGIAFDLKNKLGAGVITGVGYIKINDVVYENPVIKFINTKANSVAESITKENPLFFKMNQEGTCVLEDVKGLKEGINKIIVELISLDAGSVRVTLTDTV